MSVNAENHELFVLILEDWVTSQKVRGLSERTINRRVELLYQYERQTGQSPLEISAHVAERWLVQRDVAVATRQSYFSTLKCWGVFLVRRRFRPDNPMSLLDPPRRAYQYVRAIPVWQIETVLSLPGLRWSARAKIMLAAYAGLRVSEIAAIHSRDYDPVEHVLTVRGKGARVDHVPLHEVLRPIAASMPKTGYWFPSSYGKSGHTDGKTISRTIKECFKRAGIQMHSHQLRHAFATNLVASGVDVCVARTLLRHTSLATTALYIDIDPAQQRAALAQLPAFTIPPTSEHEHTVAHTVEEEE